MFYPHSVLKTKPHYMSYAGFWDCRESLTAWAERKLKGTIARGEWLKLLHTVKPMS
jgi:hypothetical protein